MKRTLLSICIILILSLSCSQIKKVEFGVITFYYGNCEVKQSGNILKPRLKMILKTGDEVYTKSNGRVDIQLQNFGLIRVNPGSVVSLGKVIQQANSRVKIDLTVGQVLCKLEKIKKGDEFAVETPTAVAGVRGTTFLVETDKNKKSQVAVENGKVEVASKKDPEKKAVVKENETADVDNKAGGLNITKGINLDKLKELKAVKDVKLVDNLKGINTDSLKNMSFKNLKSLNIKDMKGLGEEFKSIIPSKSKSKDESAEPGKIEKTKAVVEQKKEEVDAKKKEAEEKKKELEKKKEELNKKKEDAQKKADEAKNKLKKMFK